ncbi:MAG TPA: sterol desaturase family protein [Candidatus Binataceae bacterium]|nr:sterol desaturase family protein [Candidatus Binataceae bacterium]
MNCAIESAALFATGLLIWSLLEYAIHGWMGHRFRTFVTPMHQVHHRDPRRVFAIGAWLPVAGVIGFGLARWGLTPAMLVLSGVAVGFAGYEALHYRIHFRRPRGRLAEYLRTRHLIHHCRAPDRCFGVTSALWDRALGTNLAGSEMHRLRPSVADLPPLTGSSNLRAMLRRRVYSAS